MKESYRVDLRKITYNCKKATFLIEKKLIGTISLREKIELTLHLLGCSVCRLFENQSKNINLLFKEFLQKPAPDECKLDEEFKKKLQHQIEERLRNN